MKRFAVSLLLALVAWLGISIIGAHAAFAQNVPAQNLLGSCPGTNGLNAIPNVFCTSTTTWLGNALQSAQRFFVLLVGIELAWSAILWVFQKEHLGELLSSFILKMMGVWFFYGLLMAAVTTNWLPAIMSSFIGLGAQVSGLSNALDPMAVLQIGINICNAVFTLLPQPQFGFDVLNVASSVNNDLIIAFAMLVAVMFAAIIDLIVFLAFLIAAGQLIMTLIEAYIMVGAGAVFLGFTGSRWTMSFGEKWISYAFAIGVKLFVTYIIVALGVALFPVVNGMTCSGSDPTGLCQSLGMIHGTTFKDANAIGQLGGLVVNYLLIGASAIIFMMLTMRLPGLAASMMNGSPNLTLAGAIGTAQSVAGAVMGGVNALASIPQTMGKEGALAVADAAMLAGGAAGGGGGAGGAGADIGGSAAAGGDVGGSAMADGPSASGSTGLESAGDGASASSSGGSMPNPYDGVPVAGHAFNAASAPISGTFAAASAAFSPLASMDEGGGGGSVSIGLRIPE